MTRLAAREKHNAIRGRWKLEQQLRFGHAPAQSSQYSAPLNAGNAYAAVILSTPVMNSDNDGILDSWKAGPAAATSLVGSQVTTT